MSLRRCTLLSIVLATACVPQVPGDGGVAGPAAYTGTETLALEVSEAGKVRYRANLGVVHLESKGLRTASASDAEDLAVVLRNEEFVDPAFKDQVPPSEPVTNEALEAFLDNEWDAFAGGKDDVGRQGREFTDKVKQYGLNIDDFLALKRETGFGLPDMMTFLDLCLGYSKALRGGTNPTVQDVLSPLRQAGITVPAFIANVHAGGLDFRTFLDTLAASRTGIDAFLANTADRRETVPVAVRALNRLTTQAADPWPTAASQGVRYYPVVIPNFDERRDLPLYSFVLDARDDNFNTYSSGNRKSSAFRQLWVRGTHGGGDTTAKMHWKLSAATGAQHHTYPGLFVRDLGVWYMERFQVEGWDITADLRVSGSLCSDCTPGTPVAKAQVLHSVGVSFGNKGQPPIVTYYWQDEYTVRGDEPGDTIPFVAKVEKSRIVTVDPDPLRPFLASFLLNRPQGLPLPGP